MCASLPGWVRELIPIIGLLTLVTTGSMAADLTPFNQAVKRNDFAAAASAAKDIWPTYDRSSPQTAAVAREFGAASYLAGDYTEARKFARFLVDEGAHLVPADERPLAARVLLEASELKLKPSGKQRRKLFDALDASSQATDIDTITLLASRLLVKYDAESSNWRDTEQSAHMAANLVSKRGDELLHVRRNMEVTAIAARYITERSTDSLAAMMDLHDAIVVDAQRLPLGATQSSLASLQYQTTTWTTAMLDYFHSLLNRVGTSRAAQFMYSAPDPKTVARLEERDLKILKPDRVVSEEHEPQPTALCAGKVKVVQEPEYPSNANFRGLAGAVLLTIDIAPDGEAKNVQVLAAVPADVFSESAIKAYAGSRFEPSPDQDLSHCRIERSGQKIMLRFRLS